MIAPASDANSAARAKAEAKVLAARRALDEAIAMLSACSAAGAPPAAQEQLEWRADWGTVSQATGILQRSRETAVKLISQHGLGFFVDGRWRVDLNRCRAYSEGRSFPQVPSRAIR